MTTTTRTRSTITDQKGITWYYEQEGSGPHVVLIPDGFGECQMMDRPMTLIAAAGFTVTTFDLPGFSRSRDAPPETYQDVTAQKLASYVVSLLDALQIAEPATFWGCSAGGSTVLALAADYPARVRNGLPHEVPIAANPHAYLDTLGALEDDDAIAEVLGGSRLLAHNYGPDLTNWHALGVEAHARLRQNYARWARGYPRTMPTSSPIQPEGLRKRPLDWTIGGDTAASQFLNNVVVATQAGIPIGTLPGMHFPYVSHPEAMAKHVIETTRKYL